MKTRLQINKGIGADAYFELRDGDNIILRSSFNDFCREAVASDHSNGIMESRVDYVKYSDWLKILADALGEFDI